MARQRYPDVPRVCAACGLAWLQSDGKPPRPYCSTTCRQDAEGPLFPSVPAAPTVPVRATRTRHLQARLVTLTCTWCQTVVEVEQFPGPLPRYCCRACRDEAQREGAAERMRRMRERRLHASRATTVSPARP